ncbi:nuclear cap-binding protein subunit 3 domain-containing protein [Hirsutella rhossiliensis]|uniref:Nuclear cap-binding protein subunit 3 domain-containing protein n=1 Tax=Hirsutella rhossiliensis TaxID=111463 RepID=A0A9P8N0L2_9HYPO|nr:nuclear cap-binding protein subunit 3 domain-containing protein [Hirsutella rhossiliensis]KAH0964417.1 nuclear cap-binding protein subunit 3 domain-containing protein [Hirsutella rhossiliensis]
MDLDIEMGDVEQDALDTDLARADDILQPEELEEPGEVADDVPQIDNDESSAEVPTKIHIRGLNTLHTDDVKAYVKTHFGSVDRVEWIDDVSANLVFSSEPTAREAIVALSSIEVADATALAAGETLPAKPLDGKPEVSLQVRFALRSDKKEAGAAMRSRYYLLHPEHDPEERRRRQHENRSRYRDRDGESGRGDRRRRGSSVHKPEPFEASMYDDAPSQPRRYSDPEERARSYAKENLGKELFQDRAARRDRSASPRREYDDGVRMDLMASSSRRNRDHARAVKGRLSDNSTKELFPTKSSGRGGQLDELERSIGSASLREEDMPKVVSAPVASTTGVFSIRGLASQRRGGESGSFSIKGAAASAKELFPDRLGGGNAGKELLDTKRSNQRQKAQDLFS